MESVVCSKQRVVAPGVMRESSEEHLRVCVRAGLWWRKLDRFLFPYWYIPVLYHLSLSPSRSPLPFEPPPGPVFLSLESLALRVPQPFPFAVAVASSCTVTEHCSSSSSSPSSLPRTFRVTLFHGGGAHVGSPIPAFGKWDLFLHLFQCQVAIFRVLNGLPCQRPDASVYFTISCWHFEAVW
jgi:hypothetical protein